MKIICEKEKLLKGINSVVRAVPTRTTMPILEGILIQTNGNELKLTSYDVIFLSCIKKYYIMNG